MGGRGAGLGGASGVTASDLRSFLNFESGTAIVNKTFSGEGELVAVIRNSGYDVLNVTGSDRIGSVLNTDPNENDGAAYEIDFEPAYGHAVAEAVTIRRFRKYEEGEW